MKYYMHWHPGAAAHYWCEVGQPHRVCFLRYLLAKLTGYLVTRAPDDMSIRDVHALAQVKHGGSHPSSHRVQEIYKMYATKENKET